MVAQASLKEKSEESNKWLPCAAKSTERCESNKSEPTVSNKPTHQPNTPGHISLAQLAPSRAGQREEAEAKIGKQCEVKGR